MEQEKRISSIIGTAGHVDHGKTSLIKALTGMETDRLKEERERGVSIELGFAHIELGDNRVRAAIVDVPGHERFIRNMLAGITGIDMVLFVVAADDGVMPQTIEHLDIVRLLGVSSGVFAVTKCDLASPERAAEVEGNIRRLIAGTPLEGSPVIRVSTVTGEGIEELKDLILEGIPGGRPEEAGFFRLPVDRSFAIKGFGTVVTGTVASGSVARGGTVMLYPEGVRVKVRGLQSLHADVDEVSAGERAAINIAGAGHKDIERGNVLTSTELKGFSPPAFQSERTSQATVATTSARLRVDCFFDFLPETGPYRSFEPVRNNSTLKVHHLADDSVVKIQFPGRKEVLPGERVFGRLILRKPLLMLRGDRFILRNPATNSTIGGGEVFVPHLARGLIRRIGRLSAPPSASQGNGLQDILKWLLPENGLGFEFDTLSLMLNVRGGTLKRHLEPGGELSDGFSLIDGLVVAKERVEKAWATVLEALSCFHEREPLAPGMNEADLIKEVSRRVGPGLKSEAVERLIKELIDRTDGEVIRQGGVLKAASHKQALSGMDAEIETALLKLFKPDAFEPVNAGLLNGLKFKKDDVSRVLKYLMEKKSVVKLKEGAYLHASAVDRARKGLIRHIRDNGSIKAAEFRDILGCGRKLAIEILEYFDKERVTLRKGDLRTLR